MSVRTHKDLDIWKERIEDEDFEFMNNRIVDLRKKMLNFLNYLKEKCKTK